MSDIYECGIQDRWQYAQRADGQWFERYQQQTFLGRRWSAWKTVGGKPLRAGLNTYAGKARLPKH